MYQGQSYAVAAQAGYTMTPGVCRLPGGVTPGLFSKYLGPGGLPPGSALECQQACQLDPTCHSAHFWLATHDCLIQRSPGLYVGDGTPGAYCYSRTSLAPHPMQTVPIQPVPIQPVIPVP